MESYDGSRAEPQRITGHAFTESGSGSAHREPSINFKTLKLLNPIPALSLRPYTVCAQVQGYLAHKKQPSHRTLQ